MTEEWNLDRICEIDWVYCYIEDSVKNAIKENENFPNLSKEEQKKEIFKVLSKKKDQMIEEMRDLEESIEEIDSFFQTFGILKTRKYLTSLPERYYIDGEGDYKVICCFCEKTISVQNSCAIDVVENNNEINLFVCADKYCDSTLYSEYFTFSEEHTIFNENLK